MRLPSNCRSHAAKRLTFLRLVSRAWTPPSDLGRIRHSADALRYSIFPRRRKSHCRRWLPCGTSDL